MISDIRLQCPHCGSNYTHLTGVHIHSREVEDGETTLTLLSPNGFIASREIVEDNPSSRRGAIRLSFICEECEPEEFKCDGFCVEFIQHKGQTFVEGLVLEL